MSNEVQSVAAIIRERDAAIARGDAEGVVAPLADDVVTYSLAPPLGTSGADARDIDSVRDWLASWDGGVSVDLPDPTIHVSGDLAVVWGLARMRGGNEQGDGMWFRTTTVLRRADSGWLIAHQHESVPFLMDGSFKAAIDLKP